jgi:hypothetical protein
LARNVRVELVRRVPRSAVLVDLDDGKLLRPSSAIKWFRRTAETIKARLKAAGYQVKSYRAMRSRRHAHVVVVVEPRPRSLIERIALQLLCGSDPDREANNLRRARTLKRMPGWARKTANVLYER